MPRSQDGTTLALATAGLLAVGAVLSRRRGSLQPNPLSDLQQRLLKVKNTYESDPEIAIRAQDMVISLLGRAGESGLSGTSLPTAEMEEDARTLTGNRDATLADYAVVQNRMIRENTYYAGQDLAGRTHYAPLVPWIAREVARVVKSSRAAVQQTRGRRRATATPDPMIEALSDMRRKIPRIADWVNGARPNITAFTVDQAHEASDTWHQEMERERTRDAERAIEKAHKQGGRIAYRFPDGWTVNELYTLAHLQDESDRLHHCVGVSRHYWDGIARGEWKIFSMRDEKGGAMVTLTIRPGGDILYAKGHFDRTPGDWRPNYSGQARNPEAEIQRQKTRDRMRDILPDELLLKESAHLVAYARYLNPNAALSGDLQIAGQKVAEAQRKRKAEAERKAKGQAAGQQQGRVQGQEQGGGNRAWR